MASIQTQIRIIYRNAGFQPLTLNQPQVDELKQVFQIDDIDTGTEAYHRLLDGVDSILLLVNRPEWVRPVKLDMQEELSFLKELEALNQKPVEYADPFLMAEYHYYHRDRKADGSMEIFLEEQVKSRIIRNPERLAAMLEKLANPKNAVTPEQADRMLEDMMRQVKNGFNPFRKREGES